VKGTVLLVEDDERIRTALSVVVSNAGFTVIQCGSVKTALMHLDVLDLVCIILDLRLPNGHGRRVVDELKAKRDDVPVVILSAYHGEEEWDFPVVATLEKPTKRDVLLGALIKAVKHSEAIREIKESTRRMRNFTGVN
jgi:DNA-binding NtrC family response regulator